MSGYAEPERRSGGDPRRCHYCGIQLVNGSSGDSDRTATKDHVIPISNGGRFSKWVWACKGCNCRKADLPVGTFRARFADWLRSRKGNLP
jgi:5-methylcytosine-specific restriction endonuclease McrA